MNRLNELHNEAMNLVDEAFLAKRCGDGALTRERFRVALNLEIAAADLLSERPDVEPTRSVLYRSAASIALNCGQLLEAERLIATGLAGMPPPAIVDELRALRRQVDAPRRLEGVATALE